jgi:dTDP-4-dehydrorhamnose reductase
VVTKVLVTGSSSLVGSHFVEKYGAKYEISAIGRTNLFRGKGLLSKFAKVDLTDMGALHDAVQSNDAELVINFAAETNVDGCETERGRADGKTYLTNTAAVRSLVDACRRSGKVLYQISTDAVFDGTNGPYSEGARPGPLHRDLSWYGHTKFLAEQEVANLADYCIVRISYPYRSAYVRKLDFARNILQLYKRGRLYPLFVDQSISPTLIDDVSAALDFLIKRDARGIYHVASRNITTPFEFGCHLISTFFSVENPERVLKKGSVHEDASSPNRAPRPICGGLKTRKIMRMGFTPRTFKEGIREIFRQSKSSVNRHFNDGKEKVSRRH